MGHVIFQGSAAAIVTPMHNRQRVDYQAFRRILEYQIEGGTDAILVNGTTGESAVLPDTES